MFSTFSPPDMGTSGRRKSEILAITDKITKALHEFDNLYTTSQDDEMINDITSQIECLESGPLKYQLNDFVMRFKEVSAAADQSCVERNEVLESVMQWFNGQQFSQEFEEIGINDDIDEGSLKLRDELVTTKIGFEKLQKLNEEMVAMKEAGADTGHLERERNSLRQHAIINFKSFKRASLDVRQARDLKDIKTKKDEMGEVWKNAAGEICGLLNRVRKDGGQYIEELEKKVRTLTSDMEEKSYFFEKMKRQLKEYKLLEQKWKDDNMSLIDQKALTKKKMGKYRRELKKALEALAKYERVTVPKFLKEDDTEDAKDAAPLKVALEEEALQQQQEKSAAPVGGMNDPAILRAQLKDCRNQIEKLNGDKEAMSQEMSQMKETLEDLEDDVLRLEKDKTELMHQMKQNSLRPDVRRLSVAQQGRRASGVVTSSLTIVKLKGAESSERGGDSKKRCCKCGLKVSSPQQSETHAQSIDTSSGTDIQDEAEEHVDKPEGTPSVIVDVKRNQDEQIESLTKKCEELERQVEELHHKLEQTPQQKTTVVYEKVQADEVTLSTDTSVGEEVQEMESREEEKPVKQEKERDIDEKQKPQEAVDEPTGPDPLFKKLTSRAKGPWEAIVVCHKSIQTDPQKNAQGHWSKQGKQEVTSAWQPPAAPKTWVEFEPTVPDLAKASPSYPKVEPLREAMLGGLEPSEVRQEAIECASLVQRELGRMTDGIRGFMNFTNTLVDRETRIIASANRELKSQLSQHEIQRINQEMQKRSSSSLASEEEVARPCVDPFVSMFLTKTQTPMPADYKGSVFLDSQLPVEDRVMNQLELLGQRSTDILKNMYDLVNGALTEQHREYEQIYHTLQERQPRSERGEDTNVLELEDLEPQADLRPKRSQSHSDVTKFKGDATKKTVTLARSQSNTDFSRRQVTFKDDNEQFSPSRMQVTSAMSKTVQPKEEVNISKATVSKKGQIILSTTPVGKKSSLTMGIGKPTDTIHRKVKPVPLSHSKLKKKQDELIHRGDVQRTEFKATRLNQRHLRQKSGQNSRHHADRRSPSSPSDRKMSAKRGVFGGHGKAVLTEFELPSDFFSEYTVAELEQTAMQYATQQKQNFHNEMLDKVHFPTLNKDSVLPRQQTLFDNQQDDRFPRIIF